MSINVLYMTEPMLDKSGGRVSTIQSKKFPSLEAAKNAPFPDDIVFAYIPVDEDGGGYTRRRNETIWTFMPK